MQKLIEFLIWGQIFFILFKITEPLNQLRHFNNNKTVTVHLFAFLRSTYVTLALINLIAQLTS